MASYPARRRSRHNTSCKGTVALIWFAVTEVDISYSRTALHFELRPQSRAVLLVFGYLSGLTPDTRRRDGTLATRNRKATMHSPETLLWSIRRPAITKRERRIYKKGGFRPELLNVWHDEPNGADSGAICKYGTHKYHVHHWQIVFIPLRTVRHWFTRCELCGRRMTSASRHGYMSSDKVWHRECLNLRDLELERLRTNEVFDRLLSNANVNDAHELRDILKRDGERRDIFLLYNLTWDHVKKYRQPEAAKWRAPNERT